MNKYDTISQTFTQILNTHHKRQQSPQSCGVRSILRMQQKLTRKETVYVRELASWTLFLLPYFLFPPFPLPPLRFYTRYPTYLPDGAILCLGDFSQSKNVAQSLALVLLFDLFTQLLCEITCALSFEF